MPSTGSARLDYVVEQIWGPCIARGEAHAIVSEAVPKGWELREQYWLVPNAEKAQLLVPHDRRVATRTLSDYAGLRPLKTRLVRHGLAALTMAGAPLSRRSLRIIAPVGSPMTTVQEIGAMVGSPDALATFGVRTAANAKPTLELRDPRGEAIGFVKLAWNSLTRYSIENEAAAIATMGRDSRFAIAAPKVLVRGTIHGRPFLMTQPLPRGIRHVPADYRSLSRDEALGPGSVHRRGLFQGTEQYKKVRAQLSMSMSATPESLVTRARGLAELIANSSVAIPIANFWHGDFVWWNAGRDLRDRLWLFDWETADRDVPAGLDTLHWFTHTKDAENPHSVVERMKDSLDYAGPLLRSLGHSRGSVATLAAWYAVTLVANEIRLAESLESWERVKHSPDTLERVLTWGSEQLMSAAP